MMYCCKYYVSNTYLQNTFEFIPKFLENAPLMEFRNQRHHKIRSSFSESLRTYVYEVYEEILGLIRRADMLAINRKNNSGYVFDPTIWFEFKKSQPQDVNEKKENLSSNNIICSSKVQNKNNSYIWTFNWLKKHNTEISK